MRALSNEEIVRLEQATQPPEARKLSWDAPDLVSLDLERRGLVTTSVEVEVGEDEDTEWTVAWITPPRPARPPRPPRLSRELGRGVMRIAKGKKITPEDMTELAKFEDFVRRAAECGQQKAYQEVYGEVVFDGTKKETPCHSEPA